MKGTEQEHRSSARTENRAGARAIPYRDSEKPQAISAIEVDRSAS